ncbi:MAG: DUF11 domain-containing protein [Rhodothermia bacterium]|nr:DUF11 domain-containing protein [Rhodothermia bacterium]
MQKTLFKTASVVLFPFYSLIGAVLYGQAITGTVFRDFNANGTKDNTATFNEIGIGGVTVSCVGTTGTGTTTSSNTTATLGQYTLTGCTGATRVEFSGFLTGDYSGPLGTGSGTSVQFISTSGSRDNINFGINYPQDYFQNDPLITTSISHWKNADSYSPYFSTSLVSNPYSERNNDSGSIDDDIVHANTHEIGSTYGLAYSRSTETIYAAAFVKNFAGFGPGNVGSEGSTGAIYKVNGSTVSVLLDISPGLTPPYSSGVNPHPKTGTDWFCDDTWQNIGKISWGDIDISDDETTLFGMNLFDRSLYKISLPSGTIQSTHKIPGITGGAVWTQPTCANDPNTDLRPFALKYWRGKIYVGMVCSAESTDNGNDMYGYVFSFDPTTNTYSNNPVMDFKLLDFPGAGSGWEPWTGSSGPNNWPAITDIEFINGDMLVALRNLKMDGRANRPGTFMDPSTCNEPSGSTNAGGEVLKACYNGSNWDIEVAGTCGGQTGFSNEYFFEQDVKHGNDFLGSLALIPGTNTIVATSIPGNNAGGVSFIDTATKTWGPLPGEQNKIYAGGLDIDSDGNIDVFEKAGGLGDIELLGVPAPIEIGNRVWLDTDNDGVQDAGEAGISGVQVQLLKGTTVLATATTNSDGNYIFSNATGTNTTSFKYGLAQLMPNMAYTVRFPTTTTVAGTTYNLTTAAAGSNRLIDSNAPANGEVTILATDIPVSGANNHSFDVGYSAVACTINTPTVNVTCNDNGTGSNPADDTFTFTISATGTGTGSDYKVDKISPAPTATVFASVNYGATSAASSSFPISGGNLTLTLTDNTTTTCSLTPVTVTAPAPCSTPPVGQPDLKLLKTASSSSVNSGQTLTYTITLTNEGTASATGVVVRDVLPAAVTYVSSSASQGSYNNATGLWTVGTVAVGASLTLTITVTVN